MSRGRRALAPPEAIGAERPQQRTRRAARHLLGGPIVTALWVTATHRFPTPETGPTIETPSAGIGRTPTCTATTFM